MAARKVAVVIGYGPGIGHSVAKKWATEGFNVALVSRTAAKLEVLIAVLVSYLLVLQK
jgi:short-subunit dehydrogenase